MKNKWKDYAIFYFMNFIQNVIYGAYIRRGSLKVLIVSETYQNTVA